MPYICARHNGRRVQCKTFFFLVMPLKRLQLCQQIQLVSLDSFTSPLHIPWWTSSAAQGWWLLTSPELQWGVTCKKTVSSILLLKYSCSYLKLWEEKQYWGKFIEAEQGPKCDANIFLQGKGLMLYCLLFYPDSLSIMYESRSFFPLAPRCLDYCSV